MFTYRTAIFTLATGIAACCAAMPASAETGAAFSGPYVAAVGGWDRMQADHHKKDGFAYGATAGYDFGDGSVRFGPLVEVTGSTEKGCKVYDATTYCAKAGRDFYVGGRIGLVAAPQALLYVTGGYTNARYTGSVGRGTTLVRDDADHSGGRVGAGIEYAVTHNIFVKTEYRYSRYSDSIARNQIIGGIGYRF